MSVKYNNETIAGKYKTQIIDTSKFATKDEVNDLLEEKANTSDIPDVSNFITMTDVEEKGYLTQIELDDKGYAKLVDIQGKADASTVNEQLELKADKTTTYTKSEVDDKIADAVTGGQIDLSGYAKDGEVVHLSNTETITGSKTFTQPLKIQNGAGTGSLLIGGDVNAGTVTNGARKLARIAVPTQANKDLTSILLGFDSNGDDALNITNIGSDNVSFGGSKKITNATSPMSISFCVAKERNATEASKKTYALEMDANEARFNSRPNYNGVNLATTVDITNALGSYAKLTDIPDVSNYITMNDVEEKGYLTEVPSEYITETELNNKGYLTEHQDISNLATKTELTEGLATKQPTGNYALKSDIPDVSNLATKTELEAKQDTLTAGENIAIENNVISATINTSNLATKTDVANKQDKFETTLPLTMGGLKTSTTNISTDSNGKNYLNLNAYNATLPEYLPSMPETLPNPLYDQSPNFQDYKYESNTSHLVFRKVTGINDIYPKLNLNGYNAILRKFEIGDIIVGDKRKTSQWDQDSDRFEMVFGKLLDDGTFVPRLIARNFIWSSGAIAYIAILNTPSATYKSAQKPNESTGWEMEYLRNGSFSDVSFLQGEFAKSFCGIKFVERNGVVGVNWINADGSEHELTDTTTFNLDFNCVVYSNNVMPVDGVVDSGICGFDKSKYFVAKDTIDNVVSKMVNGTGQDSLSLKYSDDFILNENNELKLKNTIPDINNLATKEDIKNKQSSLNDTSTIDVDDTNLTVIGVQSKSGTVLYDWIGTKEEYETGIANGSILEDWICWVTDNEGGDKYRNMPIGAILTINASNTYVPDGCLPCDGAEYNKSQFVELWDNYLQGGLLSICSYTEYENDLLTYNKCEKIGIDTVQNIFRVPTIPEELDLKYFVVVANGQTNQSQMDWSQWSSNLSSKVDKNNLTDCAVVVRTSDKSILPSWYRIWSDGWIEQGGRLVSATSQTIELLVEMADTNYCLIFGAYAPISTDTEGWDMNVGSSDYTTTSFRVTSVAGRNDNWKVEGYIKE